MQLGSWGISLDEYGRGCYTLSQTRTLLAARVHKLIEKTLIELKDYEKRSIVELKYYETLRALEPQNKRITRRLTQLLCRKNVPAAANTFATLDEGRNFVRSWLEKIWALDSALENKNSMKEIQEARDDLNFFIDYIQFLIHSRNLKSADAKIGELLVAFSPDEAPQSDSPLFYEWRSFNHTLKTLLAKSAMQQGNSRRAMEILGTLAGQIGEFEKNRDRAIERHIEIRLLMADFSARAELAEVHPRNGFFLKRAKDFFLQALRMQEENISADLGDARFWIWLLANQARLRGPSQEKNIVLRQVVSLITENRVSATEIIPWLQREVKALKEKTEKFKSEYFTACAQKLSLAQEGHQGPSELGASLLDASVDEMMREFAGRDEVGSDAGLDMQITLFGELISNLQNVPSFSLHSELFDMQTDLETISGSLAILRRTSSMLFRTAQAALPAIANTVGRFALPAPVGDFIIPRESAASAPLPEYKDE